jgi:hypothetical protein
VRQTLHTINVSSCAANQANTYMVDSIHDVEHGLCSILDWCTHDHLGHPLVKVWLQGLACQEHTRAVPHLVNIESAVVHLQASTSSSASWSKYPYFAGATVVNLQASISSSASWCQHVYLPT